MLKDVIKLLLDGCSVREAVLESDALDEKKVHFNGKTFPPYGIACVMAGGSGSGKGYIQGTQLLADFKPFDVDKLKRFYILAKKLGVIDDSGDYDIKNSEDVSKLHAKVKEIGWDKKWEKLFFSYLDDEKLPNILFDITGREASKLSNISRMAKGVGYHTALVWVVAPRSVAIIQNLGRERVVKQKAFHEIHNAVNNTIFPFLNSDLAENFDEAFIVVNLGTKKANLPQEIQDLGDKYSIIELEKNGSSFVIPEDVTEAIYKILGPSDDPDNPTVYKDFKNLSKDDTPDATYR